MPRCCRFFVFPRREECAYPRRSVIDEQRLKGEKAAQNLEGERALGCLAALLAPHRSLWRHARRSRIAIQPEPISRDVAGYFNRLLGGEHFLRRNFHLHRSPKKLEQHPDPFSGRQDLGNHDFEPLKWSLYNVNWLANF